VITDAAACLLAAIFLTALGAPFALVARHRTAAKVIPALAVGAVILVAATAVVIA
jgi:hypothetical protein